MSFGMTPPRTPPKVGPDDSGSARVANNGAMPSMPDRDGPAKDMRNATPPRKATSAKAKGKPNKKVMASMKSSIKGMG